MAKLRLFLILLLSVALDFSSPVMPLGMEATEESEELAHRARARRVLRLSQESTGPVAPRPQRMMIPQPSAVRAMPTRDTVIETGARKIPSALGDSSSSSPEDQ